MLTEKLIFSPSPAPAAIDDAVPENPAPEPACSCGAMLIPEAFLRIGVFAPAGKLAPESFQSGVKLLKAEGKSVCIAPHVRQEFPVRYLAASAENRAADLSRLWLEPETDLLLAARGGFGCAHLLPLLDWKRLAARPELPLVGYSDVTVLHYAMLKTGAGTPVVGPMLGKLTQAAGDPYTAGHFRKALLKTPREVEAPPEFGPFRLLKPGNAQGLPLPGNLAVAATLAGTGYLPEPAGKILFFEDLNEPVYKLDRYLTQLEQSGFLRNAAGIVFGQFSDCAPQEELERLFGEFAARFGGPVRMNFPFGHVFPFASLNCRQLVALESDRICCC